MNFEEQTPYQLIQKAINSFCHDLQNIFAVNNSHLPISKYGIAREVFRLLHATEKSSQSSYSSLKSLNCQPSNEILPNSKNEMVFFKQVSPSNSQEIIRLKSEQDPQDNHKIQYFVTPYKQTKMDHGTFIDSIKSENLEINTPKKDNLKPEGKSKSAKIKTHYQIYTETQKKQAIQLVKQLGFQETSRILQISKKNIIRWYKNAQQPFKERGRKPIDPMMEEKLVQWIRQQRLLGKGVTQKQIRKKAKELSELKECFRASKGWLEKFFNRKRVEIATIKKETIFLDQVLSEKKGEEINQNPLKIKLEQSQDIYEE